MVVAEAGGIPGLAGLETQEVIPMSRSRASLQMLRRLLWSHPQSLTLWTKTSGVT